MKKDEAKYQVPVMYYGESAKLLRHMKEHRSVNLSDFFRKLLEKNMKELKKQYE